MMWSYYRVLLVLGVSLLLSCSLKKKFDRNNKGARVSQDISQALEELADNTDDFEGKGKKLEELEKDGLADGTNLSLVKTGVGFRNFDQINNTYSVLTGVPIDNQQVANAFAALRSTLPTENSVATITPGQVSSFTKLAAFYCDVASRDQQLASDLYAGVDLSGSAQSIVQNPDPLINALLDRFVKPGYSLGQESEAEREIVRMLINDIGPGPQAVDMAMGVCSAMLSSAYVTIY